jgi:hypothetical protein
MGFDCQNLHVKDTQPFQKAFFIALNIEVLNSLDMDLKLKIQVQHSKV